MANAAAYYRAHRLAVVGTGAVVVAAGFAYLQLRKTPTAAALVAAAASAAASSSGAPDLTAYNAAYNAGAAAAGSGFATGASLAGSGVDAGVSLGQGALVVAGSVVASQSGVASILAQSQAQVASGATADLAAALASAMGSQSNPAPAPSIIVQLPAGYGAPSAGATPAPYATPPPALVPAGPAINPNLAQIAALNTADATLLGYIATNRAAGKTTALATDLATYRRQYAQIIALGGTPTTPAQ